MDYKEKVLLIHYPNNVYMLVYNFSLNDHNQKLHFPMYLQVVVQKQIVKIRLDLY
jgi:hypothetical protein